MYVACVVVLRNVWLLCYAMLRHDMMYSAACCYAVIWHVLMCVVLFLLLCRAAQCNGMVLCCVAWRCVLLC